MNTFALACLCGAAGAASMWCGMQDPVKPPVPVPVSAPASANAKAPAAEPKEAPGPSPLEGVYELRTRTRNGAPETQRSHGHVVITKRHLVMCLVGKGSDPDQPLVRAGVRSWKQQEGVVHTVIELGFYTDEKGAIHLEEHGKAEPRRIELVRGLLRIWQDKRDYLEFERLE